MCGVSVKDRWRHGDVKKRCGLKEDVMARVEKRIKTRAGWPNGRRFAFDSSTVTVSSPSATDETIKSRHSPAHASVITLAVCLRRRLRDSGSGS
ncbi:hypothetical protein EVAR_2463_1 [Eumeta japonica]|uniref:Uncharacterized protein n=1 Tax=Eumeta variegata TaxID=151549 RepID=A0A4C1SP98_EUMVA|nr:hypothetical protein EVAR_2463_1 [Eumeta japonica]